MKDYSKTLFICTGNVYRSVVAEKLFAQQALSGGLPFRVRSRGTNPYFKVPHPLLTRMVREQYSLDIKNHRSQKVSVEDIQWASAVICFTQEHRQEVLGIWPLSRDKTFLIYDIVSTDPGLFQDVDYHDVSETNRHLIRGLEVLKSAVNEMLRTKTLSIVIAAHNEERNIENILNKLLFQSSSQRVNEIIVVSSGCTDRTNQIVESIKSPLVILILETRRNGKISALKKAAPFITGDAVLLLDADVDIDDAFLRACFSCVCENKLPCTGKIIPIKVKSSFYYKLSVVSCEAWNALRVRNNTARTFLYPSGYTMLLSRNYFVSTIESMSDDTINDDGLLSLFLFRKGVVFHYCDNIRVRVVFPQTLQDFFKQKIRTRMGRRQMNTRFFKKIEKQWRRELIGLMNIRNFFFVSIFLLLDIFARYMANLKIKMGRDPHLWAPIPSTKQASFL